MSYKDLYLRAKEDNKLVNKEPEFVKLENSGDSFVGRLMGFDEVQSAQSEGKFNMYVFDTDDGIIKTKFGAATDKMIAKYLTIGRIYFIQFNGQQDLPNGTKVNRFRIEEVPEQTEETHTVASAIDEKKKGKK